MTYTHRVIYWSDIKENFVHLTMCESLADAVAFSDTYSKSGYYCIIKPAGFCAGF